MKDMVTPRLKNENIGHMCDLDKKGFFDSIYEAIRESDGDAHEEWWNGQAREEGFW